MVSRRRPKIAETILAEIRSDIASGQLGVGTRLPTERALAAEFGVSQPTVREAISVLAAMGLVEVRQGSGTYVVGRSQAFLDLGLQTVLQMHKVGILDALEVREVLGVHSAKLAVECATDNDCHRVHEAMDACDEAETTENMANAIVAFQQRLSACSHNGLLYAVEGFLIRLIMQVQLMAEGGRGDEFWRSQTRHFSPARREIYDLLIARDGDALSRSVAAYFAEQRNWFSSDPEVLSKTLSDPDLLRAFDETIDPTRTDPISGKSS